MHAKRPTMEPRSEAGRYYKNLLWADILIVQLLPFSLTSAECYFTSYIKCMPSVKTSFCQHRIHSEECLSIFTRDDARYVSVGTLEAKIILLPNLKQIFFENISTHKRLAKYKLFQPMGYSWTLSRKPCFTIRDEEVKTREISRPKHLLFESSRDKIRFTSHDPGVWL